MADRAAAKALADFKRRMAAADAEAERAAQALADRDTGLVAEIVNFVGLLVQELNTKGRLAHRVDQRRAYDLAQMVSTVDLTLSTFPSYRCDDSMPELTVSLYAGVVHVNDVSCAGRELADVFGAIVEVFATALGPTQVRHELPLPMQS